MTRPTDARLREIASGALAVRSPVVLTYAEQQSVAEELIEARALLLDSRKRVHLHHTDYCALGYADTRADGCDCGAAALERRIAAALNEEATVRRVRITIEED